MWADGAAAAGAARLLRRPRRFIRVLPIDSSTRTPLAACCLAFFLLSFRHVLTRYAAISILSAVGVFDVAELRKVLEVKKLLLVADEGFLHSR